MVSPKKANIPSIGKQLLATIRLFFAADTQGWQRAFCVVSTERKEEKAKLNIRIAKKEPLYTGSGTVEEVEGKLTGVEIFVSKFV